MFPKPFMELGSDVGGLALGRRSGSGLGTGVIWFWGRDFA